MVSVYKVIILIKGGIFNLIINIKSKKPIYKLSCNVFSYGIIDYDVEFIKTLCSLLDKGGKFIPNLISNKFEFYNELFKEIDNSLVRFNSNLFLQILLRKYLMMNTTQFLI